VSTKEGQLPSSSIGSEIPRLENPNPLIQAGPEKPKKVGITKNEERVLDDASDFDARMLFGEEVHQYIREYIQLADQKAAFFFTAAAAIIAYLSSTGDLTSWLIPLDSWGWHEFLSLQATLFLFVSITCCLLVVAPRLGGNTNGIIYFKAVSKHLDSESYISKVTGYSIKILHEEKLKHAYELSKVCDRKYSTLFFVIWAGALGYLFTGILLLVK